MKKFQTCVCLSCQHCALCNVKSAIEQIRGTHYDESMVKNNKVVMKPLVATPSPKTLRPTRKGGNNESEIVNKLDNYQHGILYLN